ncbi:MAG: hypothetical protein GTN75_06040, partial [Gemmatimonadetes bacterium]|nr:hypothetical protein [Gemmatimonadota bacterium]
LAQRRRQDVRPPRNTKHGTALMHREIMNPPPGTVVDHADGNGLNNTNRKGKRAARTGAALFDMRFRPKPGGLVARYG